MLNGEDRYLSGKEVERWFINFSIAKDIAVKRVWKLKPLVKKLNTDLYPRLQGHRQFLEDDYPEGNKWIDLVLFVDKEPKIDKNLKQEFCRDLLDGVVAIDALIELDINGQFTKIAVDVTTNQEEENSKVKKIKGLPDKQYRGNKNPNQNIPKVRKWLGIDKHLVLVLHNQESLLPSHEKLLAELQAFAESNTITGAINLKNLAPSETLAGAAQQEEKRKAFQAFLTGYLDAAVRSVVTNLERIDKETTQPDDSIVKEPVIVVREDGTKSFKGALFFWNLRPDESVSITRLKDGSQVTPESATPDEMNAIRDFVVKCHETYIQNQPTPDNNNDPPSQKQKPRKPRL